MEIENLMKLVEQVSESSLESFSYKEGAFSVKMRKGRKESEQKSSGEEWSLLTCGDKPSPSAPKEEKTEEKTPGKEVKSPLVGVFYAAPSEGAEPFVKVGDHVKKGETLAIVEAMKLMNEIEAEEDGVIQEICVKNGEAVEYGQDLFILQTEEN